MGKKSKASKLLSQGYSIITSHGDYLTFEKPKKFSWGWFLFWFIFAGVGSIGYVIYYVGKPHDRVTICQKK
jgi:hypothetical protein